MWIVVNLYNIVDVDVAEFENEKEALTYYENERKSCPYVYLAKVDRSTYNFKEEYNNGKRIKDI